jgi:hypothetical protein
VSCRIQTVFDFSCVVLNAVEDHEDKTEQLCTDVSGPGPAENRTAYNVATRILPTFMTQKAAWVFRCASEAGRLESLEGNDTEVQVTSMFGLVNTLVQLVPTPEHQWKSNTTENMDSRNIFSHATGCKKGHEPAIALTSSQRQCKCA